ncbi:MAG: TRAP transporter substrate-binding protein DctP [Spirochaetales bacterium]|nr:TRAP transporter substrate-binding protein DctP [Spirochaetales bacterium]
MEQRNRRVTGIFIWIVIFLILSLPLFSQNIRLGSIAPQGSPWVKALQQVADEWKQLSQGKVSLKIYSGGIAGDESVLIRKMKLRQLDAAAITIYGMNQIAKGALALSTPMLIQNVEQLEYVLEQVGPVFEKQMEEQRFVVLTWAFAGWMHFFSQAPVLQPDDLRDKKIWVLKENQTEAYTWKLAGFNPVPLSAQDVMISLQSGKINTFATSTTSAAASQWFGVANHMLELNWAPMVAGIVISQSAWDKVPANLKAELKASADKAGKLITRESLKLDSEAINTMVKFGLTLHPVNQQNKESWSAFVDAYFSRIIDADIGRDSYDLVKNAIANYNNSHGG